MVITKEKIKKYTLLVASCLLILTATLVLIGWYIPSDGIVRLSSKYAVMVYNTALCILVLGIGLLFLSLAWRWICALCSLFVIGVSFLTLMQHLFNVDLGIDEFFHTYNLSTPMNFPGRMSFLTSSTFLMQSTALFLITFGKQRTATIIAVFLSLASLSTSISSIVGYLAGLESAVSWATYAKMALHTALCALVIAIALLTTTIINCLGKNLQIYSISIASGLFVLTLTLSTSRLIRSRDFAAAAQSAQLKGKKIQTSINQLLREDIDALKRFAERWEILGGYSAPLWKVDAGNYLYDLPALSSLKIVDTKMYTIAQTGLLNQKQFPYQNSYQKNINLLQKDQLAFNYNNYEDTLQIFFPIFIDSKFEQFLYASIDMDQIFHKTIEETENNFYDFVFIKNNQVIYTKSESNSPIYGLPFELTVAENYVPIELNIYITKKSIRKAASKLQLFIYLIGCFASLLFGFVVYFSAKIFIKEQQLNLLNENLKIAKDKANQASIAKGAFLATMSHEIRTPLNAAIGTVQLLAETEINDIQRKYINRINFSSRALLNLLNDILDYSKIEANSLNFECVEFNFVDVCKNICESFLSKSVEKKVGLYLEVPDQPIPQLKGDPHRLEQVISNLINNAFKFTEKGEITLKVTFEQVDEGNGKIHCEVVDTGIGISQENQQKLFKKFSQIEVSNARKFGGVGLGLSICKGLIEKMNGVIEVKSNEGEGSTFWFELTLPIHKTDQPTPNFNLENEPILVLNSNKREKDILCKYFGAWKAQVKTELTEDVTGFHLAIISTDQNEAIEKIKEKNIPILYVDNNSPDQVGEDLLSKPITPQSLWEAIQKKRGK